MESFDISHNGKVFKKIPGYETYYVSSCGDILSLNKSVDKPRVLRHMLNSDGYAYVYLYKNGKSKKIYIHHAVLYAWVGDRPEGYEGRHLDDDRTNNDYRNLAWGTHQQNVDDRRKNNGFSVGERSGTAKLTEKQVLEIRRIYQEGRSSRDIAKTYRISHSQVLQIVRGNDWSHLPYDKILPKHNSRRKTPLRDYEIKRGTENLKRYTESVKRERKMIPCACGCGQIIENFDDHNRPRKFVRGHNSRRKDDNFKNGKD